MLSHLRCRYIRDRKKSFWYLFCIMITFAGVLSVFLLMLTELHFFQRDKWKCLLSSAIQLVLLGLKCLITDQMGKTETLWLLNPLASILCQSYHDEKRRKHTHTHIHNLRSKYASQGYPIWSAGKKKTGLNSTLSYHSHIYKAQTTLCMIPFKQKKATAVQPSDLENLTITN